jgi:hypothetical protein
VSGLSRRPPSAASSASAENFPSVQAPEISPAQLLTSASRAPEVVEIRLSDFAWIEKMLPATFVSLTNYHHASRPPRRDFVLLEKTCS